MCNNLIGATKQFVRKITSNTILDISKISNTPIISFKLVNKVGNPTVFIYNEEYPILAGETFEVNNSLFDCKDVIKIKFDSINDIGELWFIASVKL